MDEIGKKEDACAETKKTLEDSIASDNSLLSSSQTKLAAATEKEATAGETGRQVAKENQQYNDDLVKQMKVCSTNYVDFETELCALKKIRGDLFKKMKPGHPGFFQDCEVTKWAPEECSKKWGGWSKCSSKCGGGMATRVRDVKMPAKHGGKQCGSTSEAKQCNVDACEKDCELASWTKWTSCSKDCDGGSKRKERMIKEPAQGSGTCADKWDPARLQYEPCAQHRCKVPDPTKVMKCNTSMDIVMVINGTPKGGEEAFAAEIKAANQFVDAFQGEG